METGPVRTSYVALNLPEIEVIQDTKQGKSIWRQWKQLSRFQRSVIYMVIVVIGIICIYIYNPMRSREFSKAEKIIHQLPFLSSSQKSKGAKGPFSQLEGNRKEPILPNLVGDDENNNNAGEAGVDQNTDPVSGDSNNAKENNYQDEYNSQKRKSKHKKQLPPDNGSIHFKGPQNERQRAVVSAFQHAWQGYRTYAWGKDHLKPISKNHQTWFGLGLTLIDSLDTMLVMNLKEEFNEARAWIKDKLNLSVNKDVNLFETTIRVLGGLLSTYHLSNDRLFLDKALDLADRLMGSFATPSGIPYSDVNLMTGKAHAPKWSPDSSTSEVTTIQLEFRDLSRTTDNTKYEDAVEKVSRHIHGLNKDAGLVPIFISAQTGKFRQFSTVTLGARGDSYYEYLLKQWVQTGNTINYLRDDYNMSVAGVQSKLVRKTVPNNLLFVGEILSGGKDFKPKMDELVCFLPGTLALGVHHGLPSTHMTLAQELLYTCYLTFARQPTFLAAEINYFHVEESSTRDFYVKANDAHYLLRPETIESLFYLYYFTGNTTYQDWGWNIFQGIEKYTKVGAGYTTISNVRDAMDTRPRDMMESFFLGETLKYLYLLFADKDNHEIDLDQWVFNTEAHPLPIYPD